MKNEILYNLLSASVLIAVIGVGCWGFASWSSSINQNNGVKDGNDMKQVLEKILPSSNERFEINQKITNSIDNPTKEMSSTQEKEHPFIIAIFTALGILLVTLVVKLGERLDVLIRSAIQCLLEIYEKNRG